MIADPECRISRGEEYIPNQSEGMGTILILVTLTHWMIS